MFKERLESEADREAVQQDLDSAFENGDYPKIIEYRTALAEIDEATGRVIPANHQPVLAERAMVEEATQRSAKYITPPKPSRIF